MIYKNLKINGIEVNNLFNSKNYLINFNRDPNVTIIYGLNGTGKTTILRMLHDFLSLNLINLQNYNFKLFTIKLNNSIDIQYLRNKLISDSKIIKIDKKDGSRVVWKPYSIDIIDSIPKIYPEKEYDYLSLYNYFIERDLSNKVLDLFNNNEKNEIYDLLFELDENDLQFNFLTKNLSSSNVYHILETIFKGRVTPVPEWINEIIKANPLLYIKSERLIQYETFRRRKILRYKTKSIEEPVVRMISIYSKELKKLKGEYIESFNEISQTLNRTFPKRVVEILKATKKQVPIISELENQIENIRKKEDKLISFGLLTKKEQEIAEFEVDSLKVIEIAKSISLWIKDTNEKHSQFDILLENLKLFKNIINEHLDDKEIKFDIEEEGYYFLTNSGERLSGKQLSSGEQHIVVLSYQLIFLAKENSLILIDEPEISLHSIWQNNFVDDIIKMGKTKSLSFLLATHSNEIINGRFSLIKRLE